MRLPVVDRYVLREIVATWAGVTLVLVIILLTNSLAYMLGQVVEGKIGADLVLPLFVTNVAGLIVTIIPLGLYLGLLLTFGRLYAESEMAALGACGIGMARLYRPVMAAGLLAALLTAALSIWVSPWASRVEHEVRAQVASRSDLTGIAPGRFNRAAGGDLVVFAEQKDEKQRLRQVFVHGTDSEGSTHIVHAEALRQRIDPETGWRYLEFRDGARYTGHPGSDTYRVVEFDRHGIRLPERRVNVGKVGLEGKRMGELRKRGTAEAVAELQWRLAMPLACLVLALLALPISHTTPRKGRYSKLVMGLLVYIAYANILVLARDAVADGDVPRTLGLWWAHGIALLLALGLIGHRIGWRWAVTLLQPPFGRSR